MNFCLALLHTILCDCILFYEVKLRSLYRKTAHIFTLKNRRLNQSKQCEYICIILGRLKMSVSDGSTEKKIKFESWGEMGLRRKLNMAKIDIVEFLKILMYFSI